MIIVGAVVMPVTSMVVVVVQIPVMHVDIIVVIVMMVVMVINIDRVMAMQHMIHVRPCSQPVTETDSCGDEIVISIIGYLSVQS
jgi:hypothetical protein